MAKRTGWFEVDKEGLAQLIAHRGKVFILQELLQNAWDENTTKVTVDFSWADGRATLVVTDDSPEGFADLTHAYTLYAPSKKKGDPEKRGRFNLGEKLVLALCAHASITTTTGQVVFGRDGRTRKSRIKREEGSEFKGTIPMLKREFKEACEEVRQVIPPTDIETLFNGEPLDGRVESKRFRAKQLATEVEDQEGRMYRTRRACDVVLHELDGVDEPARLYEMGIPVVELEEGDPWHINVMQRVPLNMDRDNVSPAYLRKLRLLVLNEMHEELEDEDGNAGWTREASKHPDASEDAIKKVMDLRFGEKRVAFDPSDQEANMLAVSQGYTLVHGRQLSKEEWKNVKKAGAMKPAGQVTPSPKLLASPGGRDVAVPEDEWSASMRWVVEHAQRVGSALVDRPIEVGIVKDPTGNYSACYGGGRLEFNVSKLGRRWFPARQREGSFSVKLNALLVHELGHEYSGNHLSAEYHDALCELGAKLARLAVTQPELFMLPEDADAKAAHALYDAVDGGR